MLRISTCSIVGQGRLRSVSLQPMAVGGRQGPGGQVDLELPGGMIGPVRVGQMRLADHPQIQLAVPDHLLGDVRLAEALGRGHCNTDFLPPPLAEVPQASCGELDGGRPKSSMSPLFRVLRDAGLVCTYPVGTTRINS